SVAAAILAVASWPWLFALQLPFGIVSLLLSMRFLPRSPLTSHAFDVISAVMNAITLGLFITGLDGIGHGERGLLVAAELVGSLVMGVIFVRRQLVLRPPMLPVALLMQRPVFALSAATAVCSHAAQIIALGVLPFYFQYAGGLSPYEIGVHMPPGPAGVVVVARIAGRLGDKYSAGILGGLGLAVMLCGLVLALL